MWHAPPARDSDTNLLCVVYLLCLLYLLYLLHLFYPLRLDLPDSDVDLMFESLAQLRNLPEELKVYPGHACAAPRLDPPHPHPTPNGVSGNLLGVQYAYTTLRNLARTVEKMGSPATPLHNR